LQIVKGDVERALARAPVVVSGTYETGAQEHVYLEPQGMIASLEGGVLVVKGSMQCPYYVLKALQHALAREEALVRVIQTPTGGGFGGKEEFPSHIALHAALLALKSGRPVKLIYDRGEDMAATTKRHPALVRHRTGLGRINLLADGQSTATGQVIQDGTDRLAVMERALELSRYREKQRGHAAFNATHATLRRGSGLATFYHGAGFTGGGEVALQSRVRVAGRPDGRIEVLSANIEMGQGTLTVFTELAAARLGVAPEDVTVAEADTARVPNSGPTVASRTTMIVGGLLERAADD